MPFKNISVQTTRCPTQIFSFLELTFAIEPLTEKSPPAVILSEYFLRLAGEGSTTETSRAKRVVYITHRNQPNTIQ